MPGAGSNSTQPEDNSTSRSGTETAFGEAVAVMARLRGPNGCPWDREQTFDTITKHTLEEAYEVVDAIERRNWPDLKDELGDLLLQVLFYSQMAAELDYFDIAGVIEGLNRKLVRRHPHVFGDEASKAAGNASADLETDGIDARQVLRNWEAIKLAEKRTANNGMEPDAIASRLGSIPRTMPALMEAVKLGSRAAKSGFDWPDAQGLFTKIEEETAELQVAIASSAVAPEANAAAIRDELGDLLFTVVNLARHLRVDPETALRQANTKFRRRFGAMEAESSLPLEELAADQLEELWKNAKEAEASTKQS